MFVAVPPELDLALLVRCANLPDQYDAVVAFRDAPTPPTEVVIPAL